MTKTPINPAAHFAWSAIFGVVKLAGELMNRSQALGRWRLSDPLLAATARIHGHALVTERKSDFTPMKSGIELWDPFEQGLPGKRPKSTG